MIRALGRRSARHPWLTCVTWLLLILVGFAVGGQVTSRMSGTGLNISGSESARVNDVLGSSDHSGDTITAVVSGGDVTAPAVRAQVESAVAAVRQISGVAKVADPYPARVAADHQAVALPVTFAYGLSGDDESTAVDAAAARLHQITGAQVDVSGGPLLDHEMNHSAKKSVEKAEEISLPLVLVAMVFVFGGITAALLPLMVALASIACTFLILLGFSDVTKLSTYSLQITTMIGLGLAIDYSLLIITRFREERARTWDVDKAVANTVATAGRTVFFSGLTVTVCAAGLTVFDSTFLRSIGLAAASAVALDLLASLTLLPALLTICGGRIKAGAQLTSNGFFSRIARFSLRFRVGVVVAAVGALGVLTLPLTGLNLANGDARSLPSGSESHQAYTIAVAHFGNASTNPVDVVVGGDAAGRATFVAHIEALPGVSASSVSTLTDGRTLVKLSPLGSDDGPAAQALVRTIRADRGPLDVQVGGNAARVVDFQAMLGRGLPWAVTLVGLAILALLFAFTGSLLIPLKTIVTTTLSIGAALGITAWIYQDGHLAAALGTQGVGALNIVTVPLVAAIAFGLAMDYEVFILGRIRETRLEGRDTAASVIAGLQRSGRIVTSAALLIAIVFCCFIIGSNAVIGQIGLGLTLAVLIDASLVRMLLVPATMALLGRAAWWAPAPLRRLHARFGLREEPVATVGAPEVVSA
ncbi:MAG TPA: MMPL family transporter [Actinocrinis sp.]|nr:MMPL family transporter [Actinocrinis sp.]